MSSSIAKLVIYPVEPYYAPDDSGIIVQALSDIKFIAGPLSLNDNAQHFLIGGQFLNYVTFLGCSPAIEIAPPSEGGEDFCHVVISPVYEQLEFYRDAAGKGPRCPHCRHEEADWQSLIKQYHAEADVELDYICPECQTVTPLLDLNWHKSAVAARIFISIYSVFPHEAVLADKILQVLTQATGVEWRYFYSR